MSRRSFALVLSVGPLLVFAAAWTAHPDEILATTFTRVLLPGAPSWGNPIWGDFDDDGNLDVFCVNHGSVPSLLHNNADGTFTNAVLQSGIALSGDRHGAAWGDYDNDGDLDLFVTVGANRGASVGSKKDQLYRNDGGGRFTDVTDVAGVPNAFGRGRSVNWVDYDSDGHLDLFVKNHQTPNVLYRNNGDGTFTEVARAAGIADARGEVSAWSDYDKDGDMDLFITSAATDQLWKNNGDGTFTEVTALAGLKSLWNGQGVAWGDYNNDGYPDLYVARGYHDVEDSLYWHSSLIAHSDIETSHDGLDFVSSGDQVTFDLYLNGCRRPASVYIGSGRRSPLVIPFTVTAVEAEASPQPSYLPGEDKGFFIWKDAAGWHIRWSSDGAFQYSYGRITSNGAFLTVRPLNFTLRTPSIRSALYKNNGDGTFRDVTDEAGVGSEENNRAVVWGDYDNDGDLDLYVVDSGSVLGNGPNMLYRNNGDGTFDDVAAVVGVQANVGGRGDGAAWGDYDNDGFLDLYVTNGWARPILAKTGNRNCLVYGPHVLYKNNGNGDKWLQIRLVGTRSNRDGIGAKVVLEAAGRTQFREVNGGGGGQFFSQGSGPVHFGLGQEDVVQQLTVHWPSGAVQTMRNVLANQRVTVVEAQ